MTSLSVTVQDPPINDAGALTRSLRADITGPVATAYIGPAYSGGWPANEAWTLERQATLGDNTAPHVPTTAATGGVYTLHAYLYAGKSVATGQDATLTVKRLEVFRRKNGPA